MITVASLSKAWTVFSRSNTGVVCSNPTWGMDVSMRVFCLCSPVCVCVCVCVFRYRPCDGLIPRWRSYRLCKNQETEKRPRSDKGL
jgi:hypothetical protein